MARRSSAELAEPAASRPKAIILQLEPHKFSVAVWRRDEDGEAVYEIVHENIRDVRVAATLARDTAKEEGKARRGCYWR
jgi:hypothetical protein